MQRMDVMCMLLDNSLSLYSSLVLVLLLLPPSNPSFVPRLPLSLTLRSRSSSVCRAAHTRFEPEGGWSPNCPRKPPCCPCTYQKKPFKGQDQTMSNLKAILMHPAQAVSSMLAALVLAPDPLRHLQLHLHRQQAPEL